MTDQVIRFSQHGGPEVLGLHEVDLTEPREGEVRLRHVAIGVNFMDVYYAMRGTAEQMRVELAAWEAAGAVHLALSFSAETPKALASDLAWFLAEVRG